ncbi:MAG: enoyl-CoA hydratase/isomerase family protein [Anaerolineae bacterium]|nr:enoyl-CoA hydratase/isomerase family protein [Anaerolineae bacterium]
MEESKTVLREFEDGVLRLTLNRPALANAYNHEMNMALQKALRDAARDAAVRSVLLTGAGAAFSSGQDLGEMKQAQGKISYRQHLQQTYNPLILQLRQIEKPIVAALHGAVAGAALGIALACDLRIAAEGTQFTVGFLGIGLAPDSGVSLLLPAVVGLGIASELTFTNKIFDARQALGWNLVNRVVPAEELPAQSMALARELAQGPQQIIGLTKRAFNQAVFPNLESVLDYEAHIQAIAQHSADHQEGVQAFLEKRKPNFTR